MLSLSVNSSIGKCKKIRMHLCEKDYTKELGPKDKAQYLKLKLTVV